jgi:hypothetical protein
MKGQRKQTWTRNRQFYEFRKKFSIIQATYTHSLSSIAATRISL